MPVPTRFSFVTLGAGDVEALRAFYERLGWRAAKASVTGEVAFFWLNGTVLGLYDRAALYREMHVEAEGAPAARDSNIAINVETPEQVAEVLAEAERAGGRVIAPAQTMHWGGTSGYFADPEGHQWEVAHNPFMPFDALGRIAELEV